MAHPEKYYTRENDSFWSISEQTYGVGDFYKALYVHNQRKIRFPDRIEPGIEIDTPPISLLKQLYPDLCPTTEELARVPEGAEMP